MTKQQTKTPLWRAVEQFGQATNLVSVSEDSELYLCANMLKAVQFSSLEASTLPYDMSTVSSLPKTLGSAAITHDVQQQPLIVVETATKEPIKMEEFNVFRDYLGLCDVVRSFLKVVPLEEAEGRIEQVYEEIREGRERRDSLGSAGSEFSTSNSVESVEVADIYYSAYSHGFMSQAFTEPISGIFTHELDDKQHGLRPLPPSLLLERNLGTKLPAVQPVKKPQVCLLSQLCKYALNWSPLWASLP